MTSSLQEIPPTSRFAQLITTQRTVIIPSFTLESGITLKNVPISFKTWGKLNEAGDNAMVICHALTGSADVEDWWGPLMGPSRVFDYTRYFIFCANVMGSPYGSCSPVTTNPATGKPYGPEFPLTTVRDDVRAHKIVLDSLGVNSVAAVIGGSMGGMTTLEWPLNSPPGYVRNIMPLATSARHSAWCISWGEAQRQSIYSDPAYEDGYYADDKQPKFGLAAARMTALLTYRSRDSFESRFGRKAQESASGRERSAEPQSPAEEARAAHNDGHRGQKIYSRKASGDGVEAVSAAEVATSISRPSSPPTIFSAQSYLRYQGDKFTSRFDANCYIHITRKMDTHDIARSRRTSDTTDLLPKSDTTSLYQVLSTLPSHALIIGIETDGLFTTFEQRELAQHIPESTLVVIPSVDGHDGFLLEFEAINEIALKWLKERLPEVYEGEPLIQEGEIKAGFGVQKESLFGEAEADVTRW